MEIVRSGRTGVVAVLLAGSLMSSPTAAARVADAGRAEPRADQQETFLDLANEDRIRNDRPALRLARRISRYATAHSRRMAEAGVLFHSTSAQLQDALRGTGWSVAGENVGMGTSLARVENAFMRSGPHRRNLLRRAFSHAAIGIASDGHDVWVTVVFYGT